MDWSNGLKEYRETLKIGYNWCIIILTHISGKPVGLFKDRKFVTVPSETLLFNLVLLKSEIKAKSKPLNKKSNVILIFLKPFE